MLNDREKYYFNVPGLIVPKMSLYNKVHTDINDFIDAVPNLVETLESSLVNVAKRPDDFVTNMESIVSFLKKIYAQGLETEATKLLFLVKDNHKSPMISKSVKPFLTNVLSLSIALQKAQNTGDRKETETVGKAENQANLVNMLSAVNTLIESEEFSKANTTLAMLTEQYPKESILFKLSDLIVARDLDKAKDMIASFIRDKNKEIIQLIEIDFSKKILAVDDRPEILSFVNNALKNHFKVIGVTSGKSAIKVLDTHNPDLFILDIDMPEMDGYELAENIRSNANFAKTPIIFLTGNSTREYISKAIRVGGNDFIVKPTSHEVLLIKAGNYLQGVGNPGVKGMQ